MLNTEHEPLVTHVAVAVILNKGRVLISKRGKNVHQGGLWEFPGGKVELGETCQQALLREIKEELGIYIQKTRPLIKILHSYPDKKVLLETLIVSDYEGYDYSLEQNNQSQHGLEGQMVKWINLDDLNKYAFPVANQSIIKALLLPDTYVISPDPFTNYLDSHKISQFLAEFAHTSHQHSLVQLRIKSLDNDTEQLNAIVQQCLDIAQQQNTHIIFNSSMNLSVAIQQQSTGHHLTTQHLYDTHYVTHYRQHFPDHLLVASCHCLEDIRQANQLELDFIVLSAIMQTQSHPQQKPIGWLAFERLTAVATMPVFALGGMNINDMNQAQSFGAQGIAAISALWGQQ
ncbi:MAG: Nudix family hydrolase [Gammaproteobacteria bacterium]|nr:Nudix family hydrolase [Gammaproteobacteria bacterium]